MDKDNPEAKYDAVVAVNWITLGDGHYVDGVLHNNDCLTMIARHLPYSHVRRRCLSGRSICLGA